MKLHTLIRILSFSLLLVAVLSLPLLLEAETLPANDSAPVFELNDLSGKAYKLSDYAGKVVVLNFWASWCPECVKELPSLNALAGKFKDNLIVLGVSVDRGEVPVKRVLKKIPLSYPVLLDRNGEVFVKKYTVIGLPTTYIIDRHGKIRDKLIGGYDFNDSKLLNKIEKLIREK